MLMILALGAMYDLRKKYSRIYRTYTFNVAYWIQYLMLVKLCVDIYVNIETVNYRLHKEKDQNNGKEKHYLNTFY